MSSVVKEPFDESAFCNDSELALLRAMVDQTQTRLTVTDAHGRFVRLNPAARMMLGFGPADDLSGPSFLEFLAPESLPAWRVAAAAAAEGQSWNGFLNLRTPAGPIVADTFVYPIGHSATGVPLITSAMRDVTEQASEEARLRESAAREHRFRAFFDQATVGIRYVDLSGRLVMANDRMCQMLGRTSEELANLPIDEVTHPDDLGQNRELVERLDRTGEPFEIVKRYLRPDGSCAWVTNHVSFVRNEDGQPAFVQGVSVDITERVEAERRLRESEAKYEAFLNQTSVGITHVDLKGHFILLNDRACEMLGRPREELLGTLAAGYTHPEDAQLSAPQFLRLIQTGEDYRVEKRYLRPDGSCVWTDTHASLVRDDDGQPLYIQALTVDISERVGADSALTQARDAALGASRAKSEFLANMSHEIRTPMNGVIGMTALLMDQELDHESKEIVRTIASSGQTLMRVIDDILDFSKIEAGKLEIERTSVDFAVLVNDVVALYQGQAREKGLYLAVDAPSVPAPRLLTDGTRLCQVLSNLVSNGVKFTGRGSVTLAWRWSQTAEGIAVEFFVRDTGIGISPERQEAIFESFSQADGSTQRRFGGTGLGLTISKRLVELMGGKLAVTSEEGHGTVFSVAFVLEKASPADGAASANRASEMPVCELRVLLAEDNPINVQVACRLLQRMGCLVDVADNGLRALSMSEIYEYDLVLMDVQMPLCDGIEATRLIRARESSRPTRLPIFALTANAMAEDRDACLAAGMDGFISKPVTPATLGEVVRNVAGQLVDGTQ